MEREVLLIAAGAIKTFQTPGRHLLIVVALSVTLRFMIRMFMEIDLPKKKSSLLHGRKMLTIR